MSSDLENRNRTATRMRYVAPPGLGVEAEGLKTVGRYEILETLGKGAMGIVYKARDPALDRIVAVKTIVAPKSKSKRNRRSYLERFEREAKAAAKMQHPAIVTIFDVGMEGNQPFMVLEYLPGDSLADRLDKVRLPLGKGVQIAIELAGALGFAHNERIVHRDVKPANVLSAAGNHWKLADFGIARMPDSDLTQVGIFMGTPGYAPPEAIREGQYTSQADVFAWGAVLYELLSGRIPYEGPDTRTTNGFVLKNQAKSPRHYDASIPEPIAQICMTALHPSVDVRYRDGHAAKAALEAAWEACINDEILSPRAFSGKEVPHSKVGKQMHSTVSSATGGHAAIPSSAPRNHVIASTTIDDEPTIVMENRDGIGGATESEPTNPVIQSSDASEIAAIAKATAAGRNVADTSDIFSSETPKTGLWLSVAFASLVTLGLAGYYIINAL